MTQTSTTPARPAAQRGWGALVSQINSLTDPGEFHRAMLDLQCKVVAAEYGALWVRGESGDIELAVAWPDRFATAGPDSPVMKLLKEAGETGFKEESSQVLRVEADGAADGDGTGAHVFVTVMRLAGRVAAVSAVVADLRDPSVATTTTPMRELAAGLFEAFYIRQETHRHQADADRVRQAMSLLAVSQDARGFRGAGLNLVNELARQLDCARVSLGWVKARGVRLAAMSDTEHLKRHSSEVKILERAMEESLDQQQPILCPVPEDAEPLLKEAVLHSHRQLLESSRVGSAVSVPLRYQDRWLGVLTFERLDKPFDPAMIQFLQLLADVVATHLLDRREADRWLLGHAWESCKWLGGYLVGPRHVGWKLLGLVVAALLVASIVIPAPYNVSGDFTLEARARRVLPAPYQATLAQVLARPGDIVQAGQPLMLLDTRELELQRYEAMAQLRSAEVERKQAMGEREWSDQTRHEARIEQTQARIDLLTHRIEQASLRAPVDGIVLAGEWRDRIGGVVDQGEMLFEVAPLHDLEAVLRIKEDDIDQIHDYLQEHGRLPEGRLATRSQPGRKFALVVARIVPMANAREGANVFEIRADLAPGQAWSADVDYDAFAVVLHEGQRYRALTASGPSTRRGAVTPAADASVWEDAGWLRPGMEGVARVRVGQRSPMWILTHRTVDFIRLWFWW